ncbi:NAD(P)H-hydrate dehydratase [Belnapia sp. T6]|uniref:ADP-dependent (S)-NAD(P)H-hydrate dehydratase n=1 Tax=Belnapia mucosa TaxID=2804532 RepID=A0ABS1UWT2_9PROT|nr:NAD(P)H-hydrate dehydratase [Belnapia mucosa]MBL6453925.1 NAD(P)H-hydrate dehydratase [Belnapia mucosa]
MSSPTPITPELLRSMPLPSHAEGADKNSRGRVLVIGGSVEVPGAALLTGESALRAGAGKVQLATVRSMAAQLALAMPEARVTGLAETPEGDIDPTEAGRLAHRCGGCDALVVGPGMMEIETARQFTSGLLAEVATGPALVLDAAALAALPGSREALRRHAGCLILTPHATEMAHLLDWPEARVTADPLAAGREAAMRFGAVVDMKGGCSHVVTPDGKAWLCGRGNVGLATSGSGDTLAGIIAGLLARGAVPLAATLWGVFLHAEAGERLARARGPVGYLAREIPGEVPGIMASLLG